MTPNEQLAIWVEGKSIHNEDRNECCPDFSCCNPELLAEESVRIAFAEADPVVREEMLMMFLGKLLEGHNLHFSGGPYERGA